jgi:hypothetical protein
MAPPLTRRAPLLTCLQVAKRGPALVGRDHRSDLGALIEGLAHPELLGPLRYRRYEALIDDLLHQQPAPRTAVLPAVAKDRPDRSFGAVEWLEPCLAPLH